MSWLTTNRPKSDFRDQGADISYQMFAFFAEPIGPNRKSNVCALINEVAIQRYTIVWQLHALHSITRILLKGFLSRKMQNLLSKLYFLESRDSNSSRRKLEISFSKKLLKTIFNIHLQRGYQKVKMAKDARKLHQINIDHLLTSIKIVELGVKIVR